MNEHRIVPKMILEQLGGKRFMAMTGAKNLGTNGDDLSFGIIRNPKKITHVRIKITPMDTYDVDFYNIKGSRLSTIDSVKNIYADQIQSVFTEHTGLYTHL